MNHIASGQFHSATASDNHVASRAERPRRPKIDIGHDLATPAWLEQCRRCGRSAEAPATVVTLKRQKAATRKSGVYRLEGVGDDGADVVAKRCRRETALIERYVYEHVLADLLVSPLRYYGFLDEGNTGFAWLFMGDAGGIELPQTHQAMAGEWLAALHTGGATRMDLDLLPDRGPAHYLDHLNAAETGTIAALERPSRTSDERNALSSILQSLRVVRKHWDTIIKSCAAGPRTLVHGDFVAKNLRLAGTGDHPRLVVLDWETVGCGPPAVDLHACRAIGDSPTPDSAAAHIARYATVIADVWPWMKRDVVARQCRAGTIFRMVVSARWAMENISGGADEKGMSRMRQYALRFPRAIEAALSA